jgi:hypothetical protein
LKTETLYLVAIILFVSCTTTQKSEPIGIPEKKEISEKKEPAVVKKDTIDIFKIIANDLELNKPELMIIGGESKVVVSKTMFIRL